MGKKSNHMLAVYIASPVAAVVVIGALIVLLMFRVRKKKGGTRHKHYIVYSSYICPLVQAIYFHSTKLEAIVCNTSSVF
jgi:hypothetical protein